MTGLIIFRTLVELGIGVLVTGALVCVYMLIRKDPEEGP